MYANIPASRAASTNPNVTPTLGLHTLHYYNQFLGYLHIRNYSTIDIKSDRQSDS